MRRSIGDTQDRLLQKGKPCSAHIPLATELENSITTISSVSVNSSVITASPGVLNVLFVACR